MSASLLSLAEDTFCLRLQRAARMWRKVADIELSKLNLSEATSTPLWLIYKLGEGLRQRTLAEHLGLEGHSLVRLLDQLEEAGLVVRRDGHQPLHRLPGQLRVARLPRRGSHRAERPQLRARARPV